MTVRNLEYLFRPQSVALIGASREPSSVGAIVARNLFKGGFGGPVMPVSAEYRSIGGVLTYPDVASLPVVPDLAVLATAPEKVPGLISELAARGTRGVIVITLGHAGDDGLRRAMLAAARPSLVRILGPNSVGITVPGIGLTASFARLSPLPGKLAFLTQSGAVANSVVDWATARGIGFSHLVSLGDMIDVDFSDMLDYLANDPHTSAILLYVETVLRARKFMSAARSAARMKHVLVVKAGRYAEGAAAAAAHTGALTGSDDVYDTAFRRAGMLRVRSLEELFTAVETLANLAPPKGDRLAILTNGGGLGVMATDDLMDYKGHLAELAPETVEALDDVLPRSWSHGNPVDILGDASGKRYADALQILFEDPGVDAVLALSCPTAVGSQMEAAEGTVAAAKATGKTLLTSWVGEGAAHDARRLFTENRIPTYETPLQAIFAFTHRVQYRRSQELLMETPPSVPEDFTPDVERARTVIAGVLEEGRSWLNEPEAKDLLAAYGIPVAQTKTATTPEEAGERAAELGGPVVLKIRSPDIIHKFDVGGVALDLADPAAVVEAARAMLARVRKKRPEARLIGFSVQPFIRRRQAYELIVGVVEDPQFGPVVLFGQGGTAAEVIRDKALALPPLNMHLAREVISRTRIYRLLQGYREMPAADLEAIALTLIKVSQLVIDLAEITELDINPLLADAGGVVALDARVRVTRAAKAATERLAIRPYPKELEEAVTLGDGHELVVRPVLPEDEPSLRETFAKLTREEVRLRFFGSIKTLTHMAAARFTQLDFDREMALVVAEPGRPGTSEIYGVVSIAADPDNETAEYAILVRGELTGTGLGIFLMRRILDYARGRGIREVWGDVLRDNKSMLKMCKLLGFTREMVADEPRLVRVRLKLRE